MLAELRGIIPSLSFHACFRLARSLPAGGCLLLPRHSEGIVVHVVAVLPPGSRTTWDYSPVVCDPITEGGGGGKGIHNLAVIGS